ncbi:S28 family serine protease [Sorangium sp. So ce381]|uniref:S28 family serine protease n=1 Tax=Sorangium sp. So ce381 TaxID=3133307 RepID=UPI003F5BE35A
MADRTMQNSRAAFLISLALAAVASCGDDGSGEASASTTSSASSSTSASAATGGGSTGEGGTSGGATDGGGGSGGATDGSGGAGGVGGSVGGGGGGGGAPMDILDQLRALDVAEVTEEASKIPGYRFFVIELEQPVDHDAPGGERFRQRLALHHRDSSAPLVLAATGYSLFLSEQYIEEPTALLNANQIYIEHRFFQPSRPDPADWTKMTIEAAAADHHRVVEAFRAIYTGRWISTGASKGGMTSVYHRRFYPDDVDGTVAYVTPLSHGVEDPRYIDFLNQVGEADCRDRIAAFRREVLLRRPAMLERAETEADALGLTYDLFGVEAQLESAVIWLPFYFWLYSHEVNCGQIPDASASDDDLWLALGLISPVSAGADAAYLAFEPYYWQCYTELGAPMPDTADVADLLTFDWRSVDRLPSIPVEPEFLPAAMEDVARWVATEGSELLFIYGENDPWSAGAFDLGAAVDSYRYFAPGENHGAHIGGLAPADRDAAVATLARWAGVPRSLVTAQPLRAALPRSPRMLRPRFAL